MEQVITTFFGLPLTRFGLGCMLAMLFGLVVCGAWIIWSQGKGYGTFIRFAVCVVPLSWVFARVFYVAADLIVAPIESSFYANTIGNLMPALYFWDGGYSLMGGIVGAVLGAKLAEKWTRTEKGALRDALAMGMPVAILLERAFEKGTGLGLGRTVEWKWLAEAPWCASLPSGEKVHPVYLYEALAVGLLLIVTILLAARKKERKGGDVLRVFLFMYGLVQVFLESLRQDGHMVKHFVHISQVIAIILAVVVMLRWTVQTLQHPGHGAGVIVGWVITAACIGVMIAAEFGVDRWGNRLLAYGIMVLCLVIVGVVGTDFHITANRE